jgi:acyl phosphate:glycerol-3-phosphate acyltransferase
VLIFVAVVSYLIGSVPFGYIAGRLAGVDIRKVGSGNVGATNVVRSLGKRFGYPVFLLDFLKGIAAVEMSIFVFNHSSIQITRELCAIIAGASCVIGHLFPVWLGFKGGKGVATSAGIIFGLMPLVAMIMGLVWIAVFQATRYVSLASVSAAIALPVATGVLLHFGKLHGAVLFYFSFALAALVIVRHRSNFFRLLMGTEHRFERK